MDHITTLLKKFTSITPPDESVRKEIVRVLESDYNILLNISDVNVQKGVVYLETSPLIKTEVMMRKEAILSNIKKTLSDSTPRDIR
ncbi:MAG: hypothetical protein H8D63_00835 [Parcubacteria group bacterium]|nr:hypothetical protein [Parcubacteria group bacterium]